jgi:ketosteroid isomerase-like protein
MSQENVEIVRAAFQAWNRGDWDATLKDAAPSFEFDFSRSVGPGRAVYSLDQMRGYFHEFGESWESLRLEADEFIEAGEHVVTPNTSDDPLLSLLSPGPKVTSPGFRTRSRLTRPTLESSIGR